MKSRITSNFVTNKLEGKINNLILKFAGHKDLFIFLSFIALISYGFELFNLNITIDEEVASFLPDANIAWISQGRWGMYLLNKFLFPYSIVPFLPLFIALLFHLAAILLLINSLEINDKFTQYIFGAIGISYPGIAYVYTFSTFNYGVGIGLFSVALSLFVYVRNSGNNKYLAVLPAAFAISIYQGFFPVLLSVYLLYIICFWEKSNQKKIKTLIKISIINLIAFIVYYFIQQFIVFIGRIPNSGYIDQYFDLNYLRENLFLVVNQLLELMIRIYSGDKTVYGIEIPALWILFIVLTLGIFFNILKSKSNLINKIVLVIFTLIYLFIPFLGGLFTKGYLAMRFLVGLPLVLSGWVLLGLNYQSKLYRYLIALLTIFTVLQFVSSINYLFASSSLALEEDRLLGSRLISRIEEVKAMHPFNEVKYLEIVGFLDRPATYLIPKIETFGASFFEWDQGNVSRIVLFLRTLGYDQLSPLPNDQRGKVIAQSKTMPIWPDIGSVDVFDDVLIVKFGKYSLNQKNQICTSMLNLSFCK